MKRLIGVVVCALGCGSTSQPLEKDTGAKVEVAQVPGSVSCILIHVQGVSRTTDRAFYVTPGAPTWYQLNGLQPGPSTFSATAYGLEFGCDASIGQYATPNYTSDPVQATLAFGQSTPVTLTMRPVSSAGATVDFFNWSPIGDFGAQIASIWGASATNFYALSSALMHTTNGTSFVYETLPSGTGISAVWGSGSGDVYGAGTGVLHSAGDGTWTQQTASGGYLTAVWGSGANDVYASGFSGAILHSTGDGTWTAQATGVSDQLAGIWGSGAGDVYVVGGASLLHSTGDGTWTAQSAVFSGYVGAVWGSGANDVYVAGGLGSVSGFVLHSTGDGNWTTETLPGSPTYIIGIWGSSASDVWAIEQSGAVYHKIGGTWTVDASEAASQSSLRSIWGADALNVFLGSGLGVLYQHLN